MFLLCLARIQMPRVFEQTRALNLPLRPSIPNKDHLLNSDKANANALFERMQQRQMIMAEFEKLRPSAKRFYLSVTGLFLAVTCLIYLSPQLLHQPSLCLVLLVASGIGGLLHRQIQRIEAKVDLLYRLLNHDVEPKS